MPNQVGTVLSSATAESGRVTDSPGVSPRALLAGTQIATLIRLVSLAVVLGAAYGLLVQAAFWLQNPSGGGAAFYPAAGLALSVLVLTPRKTWPLWVAAFATAHISVELLNHLPVAPVVGYTLA